MNIIIGFIIVLFSGGLGMYLDICQDVDSPVLFWAIGAFGVLFALIMANRG